MAETKQETSFKKICQPESDFSTNLIRAENVLSRLAVLSGTDQSTFSVGKDELKPADMSMLVEHILTSIEHDLIGKFESLIQEHSKSTQLIRQLETENDF